MSAASAQGFRNAVSRARRYGSQSANTMITSDTPPATSSSWRSGSPAATSIAASVKPITSAVPRSGWAAISSTAQPPGRKIGPATPRRLRASFGRADRTAAACRTSASFISSAGWNCSGPAPSQRRAPLTVTPKPGQQHEHQQHERTEQQRGREAAHVLEAVAREQVHHDEPAGAVHEVLHEVRGAVAVPLEQRARRGGRVDHHRAAGEQAERGREEQSVLERLLPGSGHQTGIRQHGPDASGAHGEPIAATRGQAT